jgi:hypothetical protein
VGSELSAILNWLTELLDVPDTHGAIVGEGHNVVGELGTYDVQGVYGIFVT